jgi:hypothetical protein
MILFSAGKGFRRERDEMEGIVTFFEDGLDDHDG